MMYSTIIKTKKENILEISNVLKMLLGNYIELKEEQFGWVIVHDAEMKEAILETLKSLETDINDTITIYQGVEDKKIYPILASLLSQVTYGYYDFKSLLLASDTQSMSSEILNYILDGSGVNDTILKAMAESDLNVSKAASLLFMHRNTLLYKIDRLQELKDFDLRKFNDLFILMKLLKA